MFPEGGVANPYNRLLLMNSVKSVHTRGGTGGKCGGGGVGAGGRDGGGGEGGGGEGGRHGVLMAFAATHFPLEIWQISQPPVQSPGYVAAVYVVPSSGRAASM